MSSEDIIRAWKDPDSRDPLESGHPAGDIDLARGFVDAHGGTAHWACSLTVSWATDSFSCHLQCERTVFNGTCGVGSYGCCEAEVQVQ
jgi:hypothetical protein